MYTPIYKALYMADIQNTINRRYIIQYTVQCTWEIYSTLYSVHGQYTVHCTMYMGNKQYNVQCTWEVYSTLYNVLGKYTVHCTDKNTMKINVWIVECPASS